MSFVRVYGRKSRHLGDPEDLDVFAHQIRPLLRIAEKRGLAVPEEAVIVEVGSGETIRQRPRFAAILQEMAQLPAAAGGHLLVSDLSRLSRGSMRERADIAEALIRADVKLLVSSRLLDLRDLDDYHWYQVISAGGEQENARNKERVAAKRHEMALAGLIVTGKAPYGYRWDKNGTGIPELGKLRGRLLAVPGALAIVSRLFAEAPSKSLPRLAQETGLPQGSIVKILHNPVYTGLPARHTRRTTSATGKQYARRLPRRDWTWPEQPGNYPAAVSLSQFESVQAALARRWKLKEKTGPADGWCRDLLALENEPAHVTLASQPGRHGHVPVYRFRKIDSGQLTFIPRGLVHQATRSALLAALCEPELIREAIELDRKQRDQEQRDPRPEALEASLARLRRELAAHLRAEAADAEEAMARAEAKRSCKAEIAAIQRLLQEERAIPSPPVHAELFELLPRLAPAVEARFDALAPREKRVIANACLARIVVRITPRPLREPWRREVVAVEFAPWLASFLGRH